MEKHLISCIDIGRCIATISGMNLWKTRQRNDHPMRWLECLCLFFVFPLVIYLFRHVMAFRVVPALILLGPAAYVYLRRSSGFDLGIVTRIKGTASHFKAMAMSFLMVLPIFLVWTWALMPAHFFRFPQERPGVWLLVMILYPFLAALPQEIIFRCFFFHRYRDILSRPWAMILVNGLSFGLFHMFYNNPVAPVLTTLGGCLFAWRYHRSGSLPLVAIEHGLWGNMLFTIGLGWYFYSGSIH